LMAQDQGAYDGAVYYHARLGNLRKEALDNFQLSEPRYDPYTGNTYIDVTCTKTGTSWHYQTMYADGQVYTPTLSPGGEMYWVITDQETGQTVGYRDAAGRMIEQPPA